MATNERNGCFVELDEAVRLALTKLLTDSKYRKREHFENHVTSCPGQATLIDSLRIYNGRQMIYCLLQYATTNLSATDEQIRTATSDEFNLKTVTIRITGLLLDFLGERREASWLFTAHVLDGEYKGEAIVGWLHSGMRYGHFNFVK
ncbi:MAG: hypothetical protein WC518_01580 [Patescibacteria group bacterium]